MVLGTGPGTPGSTQQCGWFKTLFLQNAAHKESFPFDLQSTRSHSTYGCWAHSPHCVLYHGPAHPAYPCHTGLPSRPASSMPTSPQGMCTSAGSALPLTITGRASDHAAPGYVSPPQRGPPTQAEVATLLLSRPPPCFNALQDPCHSLVFFLIFICFSPADWLKSSFYHLLAV